jgi:DNA-binding MurR/RpiR family transcriptional regulator
LDEVTYGRDTLQGLVHDSIGQLTVAERRVARALLAHYPIAGLETLAQLAARAEVSGPTVMRFVNRLGFEGYPAFQEALRKEIQEKLTSSLELLERRPLEPDEEVLSASLSTFVGELQKTMAGVPPSEFAAVIDVLADERRPVLLTGGRFSQILSFYLTAHLAMMRSGCRYVAASPTPRFDELIDVTRRTVVVAFDYRRYQNSTIEFARRAARRGATIILFTDPWLSPIADVARHVLTSTVVAPSPFDSLVPAMGLVEAVVAGLAVRIGDRARPRMRELERLREGTTWGERELGFDGAWPGKRTRGVPTARRTTS